MIKQATKYTHKIKTVFLSFDDDTDDWIGRIWTTDENDELIASFISKNKVDIIEQAKKWAFENNYNIDW